MRLDNRDDTALREIVWKTDVNKWAEGSCMFQMGQTIVNCTATIDEKVPFFLRGKNCGWVTAEYSMLPRATEKRVIRDIKNGKMSGRTQEIQRLIGRSLRAGIFLDSIGERTIIVDCDVLQADGGTRTCSINGGFIAMCEALKTIDNGKNNSKKFIKSIISAVSIGLINNKILLDLNYYEDSIADVDMNLVMNDKNHIIEIQATAEKRSFSRKMLMNMYDIAENGMAQINKIQKDILKI